MLDCNDPMLLRAIKAFEEHNYEYELKLGASMMWVKSHADKWFAFYPTTGRWAPFGVKGLHYRSRSVEDFIERFLKRDDQSQARLKQILPEEVSAVSLIEFVDYLYEKVEEGYSKYHIVTELTKDFFQKDRQIKPAA